MMAKITQGASFSGAVNYILNRKEAEIIGYKGVRMSDKNSIIHSFETQAKLGNISKPVAHISLDFSAQDRDKLSNSKMVEIAQEYMQKMGYGNTQVLIVRHTDRDHPHIHLILNRIDFDGKRISDQKERLRSTKLCKELTAKHSLYLSSGKENVNRHRLREPDATKYKIYDALCKHVPQSKSWTELQTKLRSEGIELGFKTKGSTSQVEGVRFTMNNLSFNGSKVDRQFSYSKINYQLQSNCRQVESSTDRNIDNSTSINVDKSTSQQLDSSASELTGSSLGLFDFTQNPTADPDEEAFRRAMQRKKRKGFRR